jgi:hypothetical protein
MQGKSSWFPEFARASRSKPRAAKPIPPADFAPFTGVEKDVNKRVKKKYRCPHPDPSYRVCLRKECPKMKAYWIVFMDSFEAHDQRKIKTTRAHFSCRCGALRRRDATRTFSPAARLFI